jgi:hypothetical protein
VTVKILSSGIWHIVGGYQHFGVTVASASSGGGAELIYLCGLQKFRDLLMANWAAGFSKIFVMAYQTTWHRIPENSNLQLKKYWQLLVYFNSFELWQSVLKISLHLNNICSGKWHLLHNGNAFLLGRIVTDGVGSECVKTDSCTELSCRLHLMVLYKVSHIVSIQVFRSRRSLNPLAHKSGLLSTF